MARTDTVGPRGAPLQRHCLLQAAVSAGAAGRVEVTCGVRSKVRGQRSPDTDAVHPKTNHACLSDAGHRVTLASIESRWMTTGLATTFDIFLRSK